MCESECASQCSWFLDHQLLAYFTYTSNYTCLLIITGIHRKKKNGCILKWVDKSGNVIVDGGKVVRKVRESRSTNRKFPFFHSALLIRKVWVRVRQSNERILIDVSINEKRKIGFKMFQNWVTLSFRFVEEVFW